MRRVAGRRPRKKKRKAGPAETEFLAAVVILLIVAAFSGATAFVSFSPTAYAGWETPAGPAGTYSTTDTGPIGDIVVKKKEITFKDDIISPPLINEKGEYVAIETVKGIYVYDTRTLTERNVLHESDLRKNEIGSISWLGPSTLLYWSEEGIRRVRAIFDESTSSTHKIDNDKIKCKGWSFAGMAEREVGCKWGGESAVCDCGEKEAWKDPEGVHYRISCVCEIKINEKSIYHENIHTHISTGREFPRDMPEITTIPAVGKLVGERVILIGTERGVDSFNAGDLYRTWFGEPPILETNNIKSIGIAQGVVGKERERTIIGALTEDDTLYGVVFSWETIIDYDWSTKIRSLAPLVEHEDEFYAGGAGAIYVYDALNGNLRDSIEFDTFAYITSFALVEHKGRQIQVVAIGDDGKIYLNWGGETKSYLTDGKATSIIIAGEENEEMIFAGDEKGNVHMLDPDKAEEEMLVWIYHDVAEGGKEPVKGLAVSGSDLYVAAGKKLVVLSYDSEKPEIVWVYASKDEIGVIDNQWSTASISVRATDDMGLKSITIQVNDTETLDCRPSGGEWGTYTKPVSVTDSGTVTFECRPKKKGAVEWNVSVEDEGGNIPPHRTKIITITDASEPPDGEAPSCTLELWDDEKKEYVSEVEMEPAYGAVFMNATCTDNKGLDGGLKEMNITIQKKGEEEEKVLVSEEAFGYADWEINYACAAVWGCTDGTDLAEYTVRVRAVDSAGNEIEEADVPEATIRTSDTSAPKIIKSGGDEASEPNKNVTLWVNVSDNGKLWNATLYINGGLYEWQKLSGKNRNVTFEYNVTGHEQGESVTWHVVVEDTYKNKVESEERKFKILDIEPPVLTITNEEEIGNILRGQTQSIEYDASDNVGLDRVEFTVKLGGEVYEFDPHDAQGRSVRKYSFSITPGWYEPKIESYPATVEWSMVAYDEAGLPSEEKSGTFNIEPPCLEKDTQPPKISGEKMVGEPLPGEELSFIAHIDEVFPADAARCGNLSKSYLELNHTGRPSRVDFEFFPSKTKSADVDFRWSVPDTEVGSGEFVVVAIAAPIRIPIIGPEGVEIPPMPMLPVPVSGRVALPGSVVAWRILAEDLAGNSAASPLKTFTIKDDEAPVLVNFTGPDEIRVGEKAEFSACVYDWNIKPGKVALEIDEGTGKFAQVAEERLTKDSGEEECVDFEWSNPALSFGTTVNWRIVATDVADNTVAGDSEKLAIISHPPQWIDVEAPTRVKTGATITLSKEWTDDNGLKEATLLIDTGEGFRDVDRVELKGVDDTALFYYTVRLKAGQSFRWAITASDIDGNENVSDPEIIVEEDTEPPAWSNMEQSADSVEEGGRLTLSVDLEDDVGLKYANLQTDEGGNFSDITGVTLSGTSDTASFEWFNPLTTEGTTVSWRVVATDVNGNKVETDSMSFFVTARPAPPPTCPPTCPDPTEWSECVKMDGTGEQTRTVYVCGPQTDYVCEPQIETIECELPPVIEPLPIIVVLVIVGGGALYYLRRRAKGRPKEKPAEAPAEEETAEQPFV